MNKWVYSISTFYIQYSTNWVMLTETNICFLKDQIRTKKSQEIKNYNVYINYGTKLK
jgi:hypothetical protein